MRPKKERIVKHPPIHTVFKPIGRRKNEIEEIQLTLDEYEAIRLADLEGNEHSEASEKMNISRSTFTRLIEKARAKLADFIINGKLLTIDGGSIHFRLNRFQCISCGFIFPVEWSRKIVMCPECGSNNLKSIAENFGHGRCCQNRQGRS